MLTDVQHKRACASQKNTTATNITSLSSYHYDIASNGYTISFQIHILLELSSPYQLLSSSWEQLLTPLWPCHRVHYWTYWGNFFLAIPLSSHRHSLSEQYRKDFSKEHTDFYFFFLMPRSYYDPHFTWTFILHNACSLFLKQHAFILSNLISLTSLTADFHNALQSSPPTKWNRMWIFVLQSYCMFGYKY